MGLTYTVGTIGAVGRKETPVEAKFLVDTGAIDCLLSTSLLLQAGIEPEGTALYELADGQTKELRFGWARICFMDTVAITKVVFGPDGAEPILGVMALESAGVTVDPVANTLKRLATRSLKKSSRRCARVADSD
jgi:predicted aspartyl protease